MEFGQLYELAKAGSPVGKKDLRAEYETVRVKYKELCVQMKDNVATKKAYRELIKSL